jgi:membrane fusion protein (multidrug efflux system)
MRYAVVSSIFIGLWTLASAQAQQSAQQPATPTVSVVAAEKRAVAGSIGFVGRIEAIERVDIRARVTGYLDAVLFKDGDFVKTGAPLYRIEKGPFEASLQQAQGTVMRSQAQVVNASAQRERAEELVKTSAISVAVRDERVAQEKTAQGDLATAEAAQKNAQINLAYTDITSPINGQIGRTAVTRGNVVDPDSGVLATIVSSDPMYVTFPVSQREFLRISEQRQGQRGDTSQFKVIVQFSNGTIYKHPAKISFVDVKVDRATDTVAVRATIPNPEGTLVDGQLVQVSVEGDKPEQRILIPQVALIADQQGVYVFAVDNDKAVIKRLKIGQTVGASVIVTEGLSGGELIVIGGGQSLRQGAAVKAVPVEKPLGG